MSYQRKTPMLLAGGKGGINFQNTLHEFYNHTPQEMQGVIRLMHHHGLQVSTARLVCELSGYGRVSK